MKALVQWLLSFRCVLLIWALVAAPIGEHLRANYLWVSGGNTNSPYYSFLNQQQQVVDISTYPFQRGSSYVFFAWGVSQNHPFMIGEQNGDNNSSLVSVYPAHLGGTPAPLINQIGNLAITIPNDYNGDLVYFSTEDSSIHYHLKIVDPPGGNYQSPGGGYQTPSGGYQSGVTGYQSQGSSYQPVYDLNVTNITALATTQGLFGAKFSFFDDTNSSGSPEIRIKLMQFSNGQFQPDTSLGYYVAKPNLFPTIPDVYDYLTSINLSPINGYTPPLVHYQSPGGGSGSSPQYETQSTLMVDQSTSNTGIPHPSSGQTWYQSFTAEHSSKLQKFAFVTNGAFTASATVKIREGEGVTGTVLHTGTWTGIGSNTNNYNEYVIGNDVVLTQGQKYTIQLENQTAGGFIGSNANQYAGGKFHYSGYGGEYGDLKMKIWVLRQTQGSGYQSPAGRRKRFFPHQSPSWSINRPPIRAYQFGRHGIRLSILQKFAFVTNGAGDRQNQEGEGVWEPGPASAINLVMTATQAINLAAGGFIRTINTPGHGIIRLWRRVQDLKMKIWVLQQTQGSGYQSPGGHGGGSIETGSTLMVDQSTSPGPSSEFGSDMVSEFIIPPSCKSSLSSPTEPLPHRRPSKSRRRRRYAGDLDRHRKQPITTGVIGNQSY